MTTTSSVSNNSTVGNALASGSASAANLQETFLKMLVTQMTNQDPTNPMDNAQLTSQLAQISTVSGLENVNATVSALLGQVAASRAMDSAALIGKNVLVPGSEIAVADGRAPAMAVDLPQTAESVVVTVLDKNGNTVRTIDMKGQVAGVIDIAWDGKNDAGTQVADGEYTFKVSATAANNAIPVVALTAGVVQSISGNANGVQLNLSNGNNANVDDVRRIS